MRTESDGYATGLIGMLGEAPWFALELSSRAAARRREVTLICEDGVAVLPDGYSDHVQIARVTDPPTRARLNSSGERSLPSCRSYASCVRSSSTSMEGRPPRSSAGEGAAVVRTIAELRALAGLSR